MKKLILIALFIYSVCLVYSQTVNPRYEHRIVENYIQISGEQILSDSLTIPFSKQGYTLHLPESRPVAIIIFPSGRALDTTRYIDEYELIEPALAKDIAVLFVSTGKIIEFLFTDQDIKIIDEITGSALMKYKLLDKPVFLAGMSLGGTMAMRYGEYCLLNKSAYGLKPAAIAICDAPLDMVRMWNEQKHAIKNNYHPNAVGEAKWVLHYLEKHLNGSPDDAMRNYIKYSPFVYRNENKNKTSVFRNVPIRMYHEPDINWWIENRAKDYNTINSVDLAGFYNSLRLIGNNKSELVTTYRRRKDYEKGSSPHTWSIVDNRELVNWFLKLL